MRWLLRPSRLFAIALIFLIGYSLIGFFLLPYVIMAFVIPAASL
jgi:phage shock protein PspC (stress-responsive transcriptional regulator)